MNDLSVPLRSIRHVFQGMIPTPIATASADGVPNSTYLSIVWFIDDERIALSNQFMGKTTANLKENPAVALRLVDPVSLAEYDIDAIHLRSETSGDVFDAVNTQLEAVATQSGVADVFRLRGVEILRVQRSERVGAGGEIGETGATFDVMHDLAAFVHRLAECRDLAEATRVGLQSLEDLFAFPYSMLLSSDEDAGRLFVLAANGYDQEGVGAELRVGEGVIGVAARRLRQVRVESVERGRTLAQASQAA